MLPLFLAMGCEATPRPLDWQIRFDTVALRTRAALVDVRVLRGGCGRDSADNEVFGIELRPGGLMTPRPPSLTRGTWGFAAAAHDASCVRFAYDCIEVDLPGEASVTNTLRAAVESQICVPPQCASGGCRGVDAGVDAGSDAGRPIDMGPPRDMGPRMDMGPPSDMGVPVDASMPPDVSMPPDANCSASETNCTNTIDDDCDGNTDCMDAECATTPTCAPCLTVTCAACQTCVPATGTCVNVGDGTGCAGGSCVAGVCCSTCVTAGVCQSGMTASFCGSGGGPCAGCGECQSCVGGTCTSMADGAACAGGTCASASCCRGCRAGAACNPGNDPALCGSGGGACTSCGECQTCAGGVCAAMGDGTACAGGTCAGGSCCRDCRAGAACNPGNTPAACGSGGRACTSCGECQTCGSGSCNTAPVGTACMGGAGLCEAAGTCCTGCVSAGTCVTGTANPTCGFGGNACTSCICGGGVCTGGDTCSAPFDVTMTADIPADTCLDVDNVTPTCGSAGGRDVIIRAPSPVGGSAYFLTVPTGWIIQQLNPDCSVPGFSCGAGAYSVAGATGNPFWFFAVERADGGCGRVNIHVSRTM